MKRLDAQAVPERRVGWRPKARRTRHPGGVANTEPYSSVLARRLADARQKRPSTRRLSRRHREGRTPARTRGGAGGWRSLIRRDAPLPKPLSRFWPSHKGRAQVEFDDAGCFSKVNPPLVGGSKRRRRFGAGVLQQMPAPKALRRRSCRFAEEDGGELCRRRYGPRDGGGGLIRARTSAGACASASATTPCPTSCRSVVRARRSA